jgi:hypothetical protein
MVPAEIPARVLRFVEELIDTVPQLETLLMMNDHSGDAWTAGEVAARVYVSVGQATAILDALERRGLVARGADPQAFRIHFADERRRELIQEVAATYRANLSRIATFIHEKPPASLKEFARAFDLKKDR